MQGLTLREFQKSSQKFCLFSLGQENKEAIPLTEFFTIGRDQASDLFVNDSELSPKHARIELKNDGYHIRDLQSKNGTFVNETRVFEAILQKQDIIRLGESKFVFADSEGQNSRLSSRNAGWDTQLERLNSFANTDFSVLISGPSGSGKDVLARWIHEHSRRERQPLLSINCSALSESLIESELFGHAKGSFTGATHDRKGAFESARGGTLFLDEIGDLPMALQPKLLRALENQEIRPVGSDKTVRTDVRIIAATHQSLPEKVSEGKFREDLYYRLNVCAIKAPSLVQRLEDFEDIMYQFAKQMRVRFSYAAIQRLKDHSWPGNIRELKNTVARAAAYYPQVHIQPEHIDQLIEARPKTSIPAAVKANQNGAKVSIIKEMEREMIVQCLAANNWNQRRTAEELGLPKSTLHDRIKTYRLTTGQS